MNIGFQKNKRSKIQSKTMEEVIAITKSEQLRKLCSDIDEALKAGDNEKVDALKNQLPGVTWNRSYPEGAPRKKDTGTPTGLVMRDDDSCETEEQLNNLICTFKNLALTNEFVKNHLVRGVISPRRHGVHTLWLWPDGCTSISDVLERIAKETGLDDYDHSCCDNSRLTFLVSDDRVFYVSDMLYHTDAAAELQTKQEVLGKKTLMRKKKVEKATAPAVEQSEKTEKAHDISYPLTYNDIAYDSIISALVKKICSKKQLDAFGNPSQGNRHLTWLKCCSHLRTICDNNPSWLYQLAPQWAFDSPGNDVMQTCVDACEEKMTYGISKVLQGVLANLESETFVKDESGKVTFESWLENFNKNHKAPALPPVLSTIMKGMPEPYFQSALAHLICMFGSICFSKVRARYLDGKIKAPNLQVIIEAPSQSGKGNFKSLYDDLFSRVKKNDEVKLTIENEWKQRAEKKQGVKELEDRPHFVMQTAGINISATKLMDILNDNHDVHLYVFEEEILTARRELRKSYGLSYDHIRKAFDNGDVYQNNKSAQSSTGRFRVFLNYTFTGTVEDTDRFIKGEIEGGTANRIMWCVIPEQKREGYLVRLPEGDELDEIRNKIDEWVADYTYYQDDEGTDIIRDEIEINLDYLLQPLNEWNLMQWDYGELQKNHARKTVRYRYAQMGFIAGMVAHLMWGCPDAKDKKTRQNVIDLARYFATMGIERYLHKYGDDQNEIHKQSKKKEVKKDNKTPLDYVGLNFTKDDLQAALKRCGIKSPIRIVIHRYKKQNIIVDTKNGKYRKNV